MSRSRANGAGPLPRVMVVAKGFPNRVTAGNMTYIDAIVSFLEQQHVDLRVVVLGDRFPNNEFFYRYSEAPHRLRHLSFRQGMRVGDGLVLTGMRPILKNAGRRTVLALPPRIKHAVKAFYFTARQISTEDYLAPLDAGDLTYAVQQIRAFQPDHVLIDSFMLSEVVEACGDLVCATHLVMYDLVSARLTSLGRVADSMPDYQAAALAQRAARMDDIKREELRRLGLFDSVFAIQRAEAQYVADKLPGTRVFYLPMPAQATKRPEVSSPLSRRCLFVGSSGPPNIQGIEWFLDDVWPLVHQHLPEAVLDVCGTCCNYLSAPNSSVRLHGRVGDLHPYYEAADVCVVPLLAGSGMKIKFVEAMAFGSACVATTAGMQGLEEGAGSSFLHADAPDDFANAVMLLMREASTRDSLRLRAAAFVEERLSASVVFEGLRRAIFEPDIDIKAHPSTEAHAG